MIIHSSRQQLQIDLELIEICQEIVAYGKTDSEWFDIESSDFFQTEKYCGGYEGQEQAFCFSYYENKKEYWFDIALNQISKIISGQLQFLELRPADY